MIRVSRRGVQLAVLVAACVVMTGPASSLALFSGRATAASAITSGTWTYYLHNNPTPPTANTTAQYNLTMTPVTSTTAFLYNYDTNNANRAGRGITRNNPPSAGLLTAFTYVNWRTPAFASGFRLSGAISVDIWSATNTAAANRNGSLIAYLRDYNPATGTYAEIANATYTSAYAAGRTYYHRPFTVTVAAAYTIPATHQLELKLESPTATSQNNMLVAYDTTTYSSFLRVR
jgi:hypothetical protein